MNQRTPPGPPTSALQGTVSFKDGLGVRLREVAGLESADRLVLCPELAVFEGVLRERATRLANFRNVRFQRVRSLDVKGTDKGRAVSLVSDPVDGVRLVEVLPAIEKQEITLPVGAALQVAREVLPALATLHDSRAVTHGAIGVERLVLTPQGRVVLVDVALGSALEKLQYPRSRLWREFRIAMPPSAGIPRFDARADIVQVAVAVFGLVLGRLLSAREFPDGLKDLLGAAVERLPDGGVRPLSTALRAWFERALPLESRKPFTKALDASVALDDVAKGDRAYRVTAADLKAFFDRASGWLAGQRAPAVDPAASGLPTPAGAPSVPPSRSSGPVAGRPTLRVVPPVPDDDEEDEIRALEAELARLRAIEEQEALAAASQGETKAPGLGGAEASEEPLPLAVGAEGTGLSSPASSSVIAGELTAPNAPILAPRDPEADPLQESGRAVTVEIDLDALVGAGAHEAGELADAGITIVDRASIERELAQFVTLAVPEPERGAEPEGHALATDLRPVPEPAVAEPEPAVAVLGTAVAEPDPVVAELGPAVVEPGTAADPGPHETVVEIDLDALLDGGDAAQIPAIAPEMADVPDGATDAPPPTLGEALARAAGEHGLDSGAVARVAEALGPMRRTAEPTDGAARPRPTRRRSGRVAPELTASVPAGQGRLERRRRRRLDEALRQARPLALTTASPAPPAAVRARIEATALPVDARLAPQAATRLLDVAAQTTAPLVLVEAPATPPAAAPRALTAQAQRVDASLIVGKTTNVLGEAIATTPPIRLLTGVPLAGAPAVPALLADAPVPAAPAMEGDAERRSEQAGIDSVDVQIDWGAGESAQGAPAAAAAASAPADPDTTPVEPPRLEVLGYYESPEVLALDRPGEPHPAGFVPLVVMPLAAADAAADGEAPSAAPSITAPAEESQPPAPLEAIDAGTTDATAEADAPQAAPTLPDAVDEIPEASGDSVETVTGAPEASGAADTEPEAGTAATQDPRQADAPPDGPSWDAMASAVAAALAEAGDQADAEPAAAPETLPAEPATPLEFVPPAELPAEPPAPVGPPAPLDFVTSFELPPEPPAPLEFATAADLPVEPVAPVEPPALMAAVDVAPVVEPPAREEPPATALEAPPEVPVRSRSVRRFRRAAPVLTVPPATITLVVPAATVPDAAAPAVAIPVATVPDAAAPAVAIPVATVPDVAAPAVPVVVAAVPDIAAPAPDASPALPEADVAVVLEAQPDPTPPPAALEPPLASASPTATESVRPPATVPPIVPVPAPAEDFVEAGPAQEPRPAPVAVAPWRRGVEVSPPPPVIDGEFGGVIDNQDDPFAAPLWRPPADTVPNAQGVDPFKPGTASPGPSEAVWPLADRRGQTRAPDRVQPPAEPSHGAHGSAGRHPASREERSFAVPAPAPGGGRGRVVGLAVAALVLLGAALGGYMWMGRPAPQGDLVVTSTQNGLEVLVDGTVVGKTPVTLGVAPGRHAIELRGLGASKTLPVDVVAGQRTNAFVEWGRGPKAGTLRVTSTPPGARVMMGEEMKGITPVTIERVPAGTHDLVVESDKGSVRATVKVVADQTAEVDVPIYSGFLAVFAPVELRIFESGRLVGTTLDGRLLMPPGRHTIELVSPSLGFRERRTVDVTPGRVTAVSVTAIAGELDVEAPAGTDVIVDGESRGVAPVGTLRVGAGTREVVLRHPELGQRRFVVTVGLKAPARVNFTAAP